ESWRDPERPDDAPLVSCTLITTSPNALMRRIHDRMPVVLTGDALVEWVRRETTAERATELLGPYDAETMEAWRITTRVNTPANDDPAVLEPLE
ncbi:MAG TPA: SOS response-associated peptidase family protein, partial [Gemmatimonadales bacterium]